ncbi:hypothetical protein ACRAR1_20555 [Streptomyces sanyensis]|uniref:hypothetical protein n=1 Tax=Streptomyces sanyensis TaxID=568869 RepID=UPI003D788D8C
MSVRVRRGAAALLAASVLCLTAACGGGGGGEEEKPAADAPAAEPLTAEQMAAAVLVLEDLPSGWAETSAPTSEEPPPRAAEPECQPLADMLGSKVGGAEAGGNADFQQDGGRTELTQQVFTFPGSGAADRVAAIGEAVEACPTVNVTVEGNEVPVKIARTDVPKIGQTSQSFAMTLAFAPGVEVTADLVVAQEGTGFTRVAFVNDGGAEARKTHADLVTRVGDRFVEGVRG